MHIDEAVDDCTYAVAVGLRLRAIRSQQRLSLHEVEARSRQEFRASVLGAYERGERAISVARLQRLAHFYAVPVDQLLPCDQAVRFGRRSADATLKSLGDPTTAPTAGAIGEPIRIDLSALSALVALVGLDDPRAELLSRFVRLIQVQRGDFNGQVLTVRRADHGALACILDVPPEAAADCLAELGLRHRPVIG